MNKLEQAEHVLQQAYDIDIGKIKGSVDPNEVLSHIGVTAFHICYYDSGLAHRTEILQHLKEFPDGQFAGIIKNLRDARTGEYAAETLNRMYGLPGIEPDVA